MVKKHLGNYVLHLGYLLQLYLSPFVKGVWAVMFHAWGGRAAGTSCAGVGEAACTGAQRHLQGVFAESLGPVFASFCQVFVSQAVLICFSFLFKLWVRSNSVGPGCYCRLLKIKVLPEEMRFFQCFDSHLHCNVSLRQDAGDLLVWQVADNVKVNHSEICKMCIKYLYIINVAWKRFLLIILNTM